MVVHPIHLLMGFHPNTLPVTMKLLVHAAMLLLNVITPLRPSQSTLVVLLSSMALLLLSLSGYSILCILVPRRSTKIVLDPRICFVGIGLDTSNLFSPQHGHIINLCPDTGVVARRWKGHLVLDRTPCVSAMEVKLAQS